MNKIVIVLTLVFSFVLSTGLVASILALAKKHAWYDQNNDRKIHQGLIPRLGGIGMALAFIIMSLISILLFPSFKVDISFNCDLLLVLGAAALIVLAGIVDDFRTIRPRYKIFIQLAAALIVLSADITFHSIKIPFTAINIDLGLFRYLLTILWIIGVTNAVNLLDGIDGLAAGFSLIVSVTLALVFTNWGFENARLLSIILSAAIGGFLVFNLPLPKAKIFMGDCGSQFLGFMLAVLPLLKADAAGASLPLPLAAALLLIPIFDTFAAIWRRLRDGRHIGSPDCQHMHHKLLNLGLKPFQIDFLIWTMQLIISLFVLLAFRTDNLPSLIFLVIPYLLVSLFFGLLHFKNRRLKSLRKSTN